MRHIILLAIASVALVFATACGDDTPKTGDLCRASDYPNKTACNGSNLRTCENGVLLVEQCEKGCTIVKDVAGCSGNIPGSECGDVPARGLCEGNVLKRCFDSKLIVENCAMDNKVCEKLKDSAAQCVKNTSTDDCGNITAAGACNGNILQKCVSNKIITRACDVNQACSVVSGVANCIDNDPVTVCGTITDKGICQDNKVKRCVNKQLVTIACESHQSCVPASSNSGAYCQDDPVSGCGEIPKGGVCEGKTLKYCSNKQLKTQVCSDVCIVLESDKAASCAVACPANFPSFGTCSSNDLKYCEKATDGKSYLIEVDCAKTTYPYCGFDLANAQFNCIEKTACDGYPSHGVCVGNALWKCVSNTIQKSSCGSETCMNAQITVSSKLYVYGYCTAPCGSVTDKGICIDGVSKYCDNGKLHVDNCLVTGRTCKLEAETAVCR